MRLLFQGIARPSAAGSLRAAGYRSVSRAILQFGESAAPHLATPALPALLAEVRAVVAASDPRASEAGGGGSGGGGGAADVVTAPGTTSGGGKRGMGIEPAMSARKSSQKKQRRSREKEVGRALAAADAAATATAAGNSVAVGGGGGMVWTGAAALAEQEAVCAGLSCLSQLVVCCKGHLPLGGRLAVEDVLHRGLELLAHAGVGGSKGSSGEGSAPNAGGGGRIGGAGVGRGCLRLEDPQVAREFFGLAQACLMTPLVRAKLKLCVGMVRRRK